MYYCSITGGKCELAEWYNGKRTPGRKPAICYGATPTQHAVCGRKSMDGLGPLTPGGVRFSALPRTGSVTQGRLTEGRLVSHEPRFSYH